MCDDVKIMVGAFRQRCRGTVAIDKKDESSSDQGKVYVPKINLT